MTNVLQHTQNTILERASWCVSMTSCQQVLTTLDGVGEARPADLVLHARMREDVTEQLELGLCQCVLTQSAQTKVTQTTPA